MLDTYLYAPQSKFANSDLCSQANGSQSQSATFSRFQEIIVFLFGHIMANTLLSKLSQSGRIMMLVVKIHLYLKNIEITVLNEAEFFYSYFLPILG